MLKDIKLVEEFKISTLINALIVAYTDRFYKRLATWWVDTPEAERPAKLTAQMNAFSMAYEQLDQAYLLSSKSALTERIKEKDQRRDDLLTSLREIITIKLRIGTAEEKEAALLIKDIDARYAVKQRDRYEEEGLKMAQMCSDLIGSMKNTKALQAIGAKELVQEMQTVNTECRELVTLRNSERSQQDKGQMQAARDRMVEEYRLTVLLLNALALTDADEQRYEPLVRELNEDIRYYRKVVLQKKEGNDDEDPEPDQQQA